MYTEDGTLKDPLEEIITVEEFQSFAKGMSLCGIVVASEGESPETPITAEEFNTRYAKSIDKLILVYVW